LLSLTDYETKLTNARTEHKGLKLLIEANLQDILSDATYVFIVAALTDRIFNSDKRNKYYALKEYFKVPSSFIALHFGVAVQTVDNAVSTIREVIRDKPLEKVFSKNPSVVSRVGELALNSSMVTRYLDLNRQIPRLEKAVAKRS